MPIDYDKRFWKIDKAYNEIFPKFELFLYNTLQYKQIISDSIIFQESAVELIYCCKTLLCEMQSVEYRQFKYFCENWQLCRYNFRHKVYLPIWILLIEALLPMDLENPFS